MSLYYNTSLCRCIINSRTLFTGYTLFFIPFKVGRGRNAKDKCMFLLYLHAISVSNSKASAADASHGLHMDFSTKVKKNQHCENIVFDLQFFSLVLEKKFASQHVFLNMCVVLYLKVILFTICTSSVLQICVSLFFRIITPFRKFKVTRMSSDLLLGMLVLLILCTMQLFSYIEIVIIIPTSQPDMYTCVTSYPDPSPPPPPPPPPKNQHM